MFGQSIEKRLTERRLSASSQEAQRIRQELRVLGEQLGQVQDEAEDFRLRSLVSETPLASAEHRDAAKAVSALRRDWDAKQKRLEKLELKQDELLDQLTKLTKPTRSDDK